MRGGGKEGGGALLLSLPLLSFLPLVPPGQVPPTPGAGGMAVTPHMGKARRGPLVDRSLLLDVLRPSEYQWCAGTASLLAPNSWASTIRCQLLTDAKA